MISDGPLTHVHARSTQSRARAKAIGTDPRSHRHMRVHAWTPSEGMGCVSGRLSELWPTAGKECPSRVSSWLAQEFSCDKQ